MMQPHLAIALVMAVLLLQSAYEMWAHDAGDPPWRWWGRLLNAVIAAIVIVIEVRRGRRTG